MSMKNGTISTYCGKRMTMHPSGICSQCRRLSCTKPCKICGETGRNLYDGVCTSCRTKAKTQRAKAFYPKAIEQVRQTLTLLELLDAYLEHDRKGTGTSNIKQHENFIKNYIRPAIGSRKIKSLTLNHLQAIIDDAYAEKQLAKKTLQDLRGCISGFLRFCRLGKYTTLVSMDLQIPRSAKRPHKNILGAQELQNLFILENTVLNSKSQPDWCIHAYRFSVLNGLRPGELIGLRWEDIQGNILHIDRSVNHYKEVTEGKNENSQREIFLQGLAMAELEAQRQQLRQAGIISPWVSPNEHGACFTQSTFRKRWNRYCSVNNIQNITLYELRHTFVSVCDDMPDGLKKKVVGHSQSMDTDGIYGHRKVGDLERAAAYSDAAFRAIL